MNEIAFQNQLKLKLKDSRLGILSVDVKAEKTPDELSKEIDRSIINIRSTIKIEDVNSIPLINQTRKAYKVLGKDPSRYRPSAEALLRRIIQGKGLYRINNLVDLLNLVSIRTGFSIGGYDLDKIYGKIILSEGKDDDPYEAIGRGQFNIHQLPVLRDSSGPFGCPTSDSSRTMVTGSTSRFLMVFFDFHSSEDLSSALDLTSSLIDKYIKSSNQKINITD